MTDPKLLAMPPGFLWGAATAAHQVEGHNTNNQWAAWEQQPGRIYDGHRAGKANDWWNLESAAADFDRAAELGINSLRLSLEWSRIEPEPGEFDRAAIRRYAEMLSMLRARGIEPMVTLHHFTDPLWLTSQGGWENPLIVDYFARFTTRVVEDLGEYTTLWCTINEPIVYAYIGYVDGVFPPGVHGSLPRALGVLRRMLFAHARAYRIIHRLQNDARVGLAHHMRLFVPADINKPGDRRIAAFMNQVANRATLEAVTHGRLTPLLGYGQRVPQLMDSCDYLGLNFYTTVRVAFDPAHPQRMFAREFFDPTLDTSDMTPQEVPYGEINPEGLYLALKQIAQYGKPIYITENGLPDSDDDQRPRFLVTYLAELWRAVEEGVDVRGYYHWTLVDNFEWAAGWALRFGLYDLDVATGERTARSSAAVFERIARSNGIPRSLMEKLAPDAVDTYFDGRLD